MSDTLTASRSAAETERGNQHGDFIWYELLTSDPDAAQDFYGKVVGWKFRSAEMPDMDYRLISATGAKSGPLAGKDDVAGLMKIAPDMGDMEPAWLGYIGVEDVDAAADRIKAAGGAVHIPPTDIPNVGRFAFVADPQGVVFYIMRGLSVVPSEAFKAMAEGHGRWNELVTTDQATALDFYIGQFGWEKGDAMSMGEAGDYRFVNHRGEMIGGVMDRTDPNQPPMWNYYFGVPSIANAAETIRTNGGTITYGPAEVPGGDYVVNAIDPQGAAFGLVGPEK